MAAEKTVPSTLPTGKPRYMEWQQPEPTRCLWRTPVERDGIQVGELMLFLNPQLERAWHFKLVLHGEEVYRWDVRPSPSGHNNPVAGCPDGFPRKIRGREHEHVWAPDLECNCACDLDASIDTSTHERMFVEFCARTNLVCGPAYAAPMPDRELPFDA